MLDDDDDIVCVRLTPRPWRWLNVAGATLQFGSNVARSLGAWAEDLSTMAAQHTAWQWDRMDAVERMHADLEAL